MAHAPVDERLSERALDRTDRVVAQLRPHARPLSADADLDPLLARVGDARFVLLGEASHGTQEFYAWRARITQRLLREKGFSFVAVEGDWPDCQRLDRYVKGAEGAHRSARAVLESLERWPAWMWANTAVAEFSEWLRAHNGSLARERRAGFYGLDVYSLWDSMRAVLGYLDRVDPQAAQRARGAYECFAPFGEDEQLYARAAALVPASCEDAVVRALAEVRRGVPSPAGDDRDARFEAEQNALVAKNAEHYYRTMVRGDAASWNVRDEHMAETLERLCALHGPGSKAVVWAHNTHVGDARFTDMAQQGEINLGQLVRERHGPDGVVLVGFSTHHGTVLAGERWGARVQRMRVPAARPGSFEDVMQRLGVRDALLLFGDAPGTPELLERRGHRAIGVVYRPQFERYGSYVPTVLPRRYDAMLYVEETTALTPVHASAEAPPSGEVPETFPSGM